MFIVDVLESERKRMRMSLFHDRCAERGPHLASPMIAISRSRGSCGSSRLRSTAASTCHFTPSGDVQHAAWLQAYSAIRLACSQKMEVLPYV